jgi:alkanesulfonate monooxygenase SsuD/methylene tetrahydromethanopterin reductase-like flavin-dependent oxidoreductase (luciferase family)
MRLGLNVGYWGMGIGREDQLAVVQEAERLGFDSVWAAEAYSVGLAVSDDHAAARDLMRPMIAPYVGGMGSRRHNFYNQLVQRYGFEDAPREVQDLYLDGRKEEAAAALPDALIDMVSLCGPPGAVRERLSAFSEAGVGTLAVIPMASDRPSRVAQLRAVAELAA